MARPYYLPIPCANWLCSLPLFASVNRLGPCSASEKAASFSSKRSCLPSASDVLRVPPLAEGDLIRVGWDVGSQKTQQAPQGVLKFLLSFGTRFDCAPGDKAIWPHEDGPGLPNAIHLREPAFHISKTLLGANDMGRQHEVQPVRQPLCGLVPPGRGSPTKQGPARLKEINGRKPRAVVL